MEPSNEIVLGSSSENSEDDCVIVEYVPASAVKKNTKPINDTARIKARSRSNDEDESESKRACLTHSPKSLRKPTPNLALKEALNATRTRATMSQAHQGSAAKQSLNDIATPTRTLPRVSLNNLSDKQSLYATPPKPQLLRSNNAASKTSAAASNITPVKPKPASQSMNVTTTTTSSSSKMDKTRNLLTQSLLVTSQVEVVHGIASDDPDKAFSLTQAALNCQYSSFLQNFLFGSSHMDEMSLTSLNNLFDRFYKYFSDRNKDIAYNDCVFFLTRYFSALRRVILHVYLDVDDAQVAMKRHAKEARHLLVNMHDILELMLNCICDSTTLDDMRMNVAFFKIYCDLYNSFIAHLVKTNVCEQITEESIYQHKYFRPHLSKILLIKFSEIIVKLAKNSNMFVSKDFKIVCHRIQELFYQRFIFSQTSAMHVKQKLKEFVNTLETVFNQIGSSELKRYYIQHLVIKDEVKLKLIERVLVVEAMEILEMNEESERRINFYNVILEYIRKILSSPDERFPRFKEYFYMFIYIFSSLFPNWENNSMLEHLEESSTEESINKYQNLLLEIRLELDENETNLKEKNNKELIEFNVYFNGVFDKIFS